jgi:hypothetical protein
MDMLDRCMTHVLGGKERAGASFHHIAQNTAQFLKNEFFISGIFHLIYLDHK